MSVFSFYTPKSHEKTRDFLTFSRFIEREPWPEVRRILEGGRKAITGISGNLVVKRKLPPRSGSSLETVEPHP